MHHGTLTFPASAEGLYESAKRYVSHDPREARLFNRLEHARNGRRYHLTINHRNDDHFDPSTNTIAWDPYSALRTTRGGRQSPALGLAHEVDHAVEAPAVQARLQRIADPRYDNAEERRVITGSEAHAARILHESVRHDHAGSTYRVTSPVLR
jgi:hypothetical protein